MPFIYFFKQDFFYPCLIYIFFFLELQHNFEVKHILEPSCLRVAGGNRKLWKNKLKSKGMEKQTHKCAGNSIHSQLEWRHALKILNSILWFQ